MASLVERNEAGLVDTRRCRGQRGGRGHDYGSRLSACPARLRMRGLCGRGGTQALSQVRAVGRVSGEILNKVETLSLYRAREAAPMNTVKWRGLRMAAAVAVAGFVLLAAILAVSPDVTEAGRSGSDTTPPGRTDGSPTGTLPARTTSTTPSLNTDEAATCRYSTTAGVSYTRMKNTFSNTGGTSHATSVGGLEDGSTFTFYVRCRDLSRNANPDDYPIRLSVQSGADCGTPSANAYGAGTPAVGASDPSSSGPVGTWTFVPSPNVESASPSIVVDNSLQGIEAIAPDDVWTVGYANNPSGPQYSIQTLALHWDGSAWSIVATPNAPMDWSRLYGVAATSSNDVWAVGASQDVASVPGRTLVEHWDGTAWSIVPSSEPGRRRERAEGRGGRVRERRLGRWLLRRMVPVEHAHPALGRRELEPGPEPESECGIREQRALWNRRVLRGRHLGRRGFGQFDEPLRAARPPLGRCGLERDLDRRAGRRRLRIVFQERLGDVLRRLTGGRSDRLRRWLRRRHPACGLRRPLGRGGVDPDHGLHVPRPGRVLLFHELLRGLGRRERLRLGRRRGVGGRMAVPLGRDVSE